MPAKNYKNIVLKSNKKCFSSPIKDCSCWYHLSDSKLNWDAIYHEIEIKFQKLCFKLESNKKREMQNRDSMVSLWIIFSVKKLQHKIRIFEFRNRYLNLVRKANFTQQVVYYHFTHFNCHYLTIYNETFINSRKEYVFR